MQPQLPEDLKKAVGLLENSEKESNRSLRMRAFKDAVDILNDHLNIGPDSPHKSFVENIKLTYTRKFLEELTKLFNADIEVWFDYTQLFLLKVPKEVEVNIEKHPQLKKDYEKFIGIWRDEAIKLFQGLR